ncbi:MAG: ATP-binding cassette domain-containing protein [Gammaproteobacteria bacterium]|jgi:ATP-binding cassette subfamily F protein 3|nr:ATP-binding cassette domain-containing protein [Gammaproteobacteria bacterium]
MLALRNIAIQRGGRTLLEKVDLVLHAGQKAGITGVNGCGKSSLFALLLGELHAETGEAELPGGVLIAHVAQEVPAGTQTALDFVLAGDAAVARLESELRAAEQEGDGTRLAHLYADYEAHDGYRARSRAATILHGLGFVSADHARCVEEFSGGWRARLNLARALMCPSDLLLLDEPTNHLDLDAVIWLEGWLQRYPGTLLLISHDRDFLDNVTGAIAHIENRQLTLYSGNYAQFERQRAERLAQQQALADRQQREIAHIRSFVERFRAKATKARQAQSRLRTLARMELVAAAEIDSPIRFTFREPERCPSPLLRLEEVAAGYAEQSVFEDVDVTLAPGTRLGLLGRNGAGKSTLVKLLAGALAPRAGTRTAARHLEIGYFAQHQLEALRSDESPLQHLQRLDPRSREQELRDFIGGFGFRGDDALRRVATFSGGERTRLALALLVQRKPNLLLLDEPTNHLDMLMRDALVEALQDFPGALVVVSHDRYLLRAATDELLLVADGSVAPFAGDLDDYRDWLMRGDPPEADDDTSTRPGTKEARTTEGRARKRAEAERRQARSRERRPLERSLKKLETRLEALQQALDDSETRLADPAIYTPDMKADLTAELQRRGELQTELAYTEKMWFEVGEELERIGSG